MKRILKNGTILFAEEFSVKLLGFIITIIITRALSPSQLGEIITGTALMSNLILLADCGLRTVALIETAKPPESQRFTTEQLFSVRLITHLAVIIPSLVIISLLPIDKSLKSIFIIYSGALLFEGLFTDWYFRGKRNYLPSAAARIGANILYLAGVGVLSWFSISPLTVAAVFITANITAAFSLYKFSQIRFILPSAETLKKVLYTSLPVGGGKILQQLPLYLPPLLITSLASSADTALFGTAFKIITLSMVADRIINVLFLGELPVLWHDDQKRALIKIRQLYRGIISFSVLVILFYKLCGAQLLAFIFGEHYSEAASILHILSFFYFFTLLNSVVSHSIIALKESRSYLRVSAIASLLSLPILPVLTIQYGAVGAAVAVSIAEGVIFVLSELKMRSTLKLPLSILTSTLVIEILYIYFKSPALNTVCALLLIILLIFNTIALIREK